MLPVAILAGGLAMRLRPITAAIPKALVQIHGEPFLAHQLRLLRRSGIEQVVLCIGYRGEQIREYVSDGRAFGLRIEYCFDGEQLLGTAGAIRKARPLLGAQFFVLYGDSYLACDYGAVERAFHSSGKPALMTVFLNDGHWEASNVEYSNGAIIAYDKVNRTEAMRHIDYGLGVFRSEAFDSLVEGQRADLARLYQQLLRHGQLAAYEVPTRFYEIGSLDGIRDLEEFLAR